MRKILKQIVTDDLRHLFDVLQPDECRLVGGVVREYILGQVADDIDIATTAEPNEVTSRLEMAGIKAVPTGIEHGTITAVLNKKNYEITTLRKDIKTDGRHAEVTYTKSFKEDAERRDLTINGMYLDLDGILTDFFCGEEDLESGRIRFIGDAEQRIKEDYLRILRYFRFYSRFSKGRPDPKTLSIIKKNASFIKGLSMERITAELFKTVSTKQAAKTWEFMDKHSVLAPCGLHRPALTAFRDFCIMFPQERNPLIRLACLYPNKDSTFITADARLRFSNNEKKFLKEVFKALKEKPTYQIPEHAVYRLGKNVFNATLMIEASYTKSKETRDMCLDYLNIVQQFTIPTFPISGKDLKARGIVSGPALGKMLTDVEDWWIEQDFPEKRVCLSYLEKLEEASFPSQQSIANK